MATNLAIDDAVLSALSLKDDCLLEVLDHNAQLRGILARGDELQLPNWYVGAGFIRQTYWNHRHGFDLLHHIKDIDIAYFDDTDLSEASERDHECRIQSLFSKVPLKFDVKNQARVHLWYAQRFGKSIAPYRSTEDAINTWPTTATSIGIRSSGLELHLCAPFGLEDLLEMIVRPNKVQITREIYDAKIERWAKCWPLLKILPWE